MSGNKADEVLNVVRALARNMPRADFIFRGEPKCYDKVCSSLYRQHQDINADHFNLEIVQQEILKVAKKYTHENDEFEILTQLQHYGGKTNLIDFTTDCLVALFFACDSLPDEDGRVILLRKSGPMRRYIQEPRNPANRVIAQKSIFIRPPKGFVEPHSVVVIPHELKQPTLDYLRSLHGISSETIYNDLHGFIRVQDIHESIYATFYEGRTLQIQGQYQQAIERYSQIIELNPLLAAAYNNRGNCFYHSGQNDLAILDFDQALELEPRNADAYSNRGNVHLRKGNLALAIQDHGRSLELDPGSAETHYNRGNAYIDSGDLACGIQDYSKALELNRGDTAVYSCYRRGIAWLRLGEWEKARSDLASTESAGLNLATAFRSIGYAGVADFEQKHDVRLPEDIAVQLAG